MGDQLPIAAILIDWLYESVTLFCDKLRHAGIPVLVPKNKEAVGEDSL